MCKLQNKEMEKLVYGEVFVEFPLEVLEVLEVLEWIKMAWKYGRERVPMDTLPTPVEKGSSVLRTSRGSCLCLDCFREEAKDLPQTRLA